jgi:hypothetical protein
MIKTSLQRIREEKMMNITLDVSSFVDPPSKSLENNDY